MLARSIDGLTLMRTTNMVTFSGICVGHTGVDYIWRPLHVAWAASGVVGGAPRSQRGARVPRPSPTITQMHEARACRRIEAVSMKPAEVWS